MTRGAIAFLSALAILAVLASPASASDNSWLDRAHATIEEDLTGTVRWFDRFFADDIGDIAEYGGNSLRITNDFRWDQEDEFTYRIQFRARLRLPHLKDRWHLVISGENQGDPNPTQPEDPGNPGLAVVSSTGRASTEATYDLLRTRNTFAFAGAGIRIHWLPSVFGRIRLMHARELGYSVIGRVAITPYWDSEDGFGNTNEIDFERPIGPATMLRLSSFAAIRESETGWHWGSELSVLHRLTATSGITVGGSVLGMTRPVAVMENYRVFARYRSNIYRSWLFYELEPDVNWRWQEDGSRDTILGGTVRVEVNFLGEAAPRTSR